MVIGGIIRNETKRVILYGIIQHARSAKTRAHVAFLVLRTIQETPHERLLKHAEWSTNLLDKMTP